MSFPRIRRDLTRLKLPCLQITSPAKTARVYRAHTAAIDSLIENSNVVALQSLQSRRLSLDELVKTLRGNGTYFPKYAEPVQGFVYVMERPQTRLLKIGYSTNVLERRASLETAVGERVVLLGCFQASKREELAAHKQFAEHRTIGEWFRDAPEIRDWIKSSQPETRKGV